MTKMGGSTDTGDRGRSRTESIGADERRRCGWCRRVLPERTGPGRPRRFCSQRCRQWNWVASERSAELALNEHELVIARDELDRLHDDLYVLACAVEDIERDQAATTRKTIQSLEDHLEWLLQAATPLKDRTLRAM